MSSEVHIVCDVCKQTMYRGDKPMAASAILAPMDLSSRAAPRPLAERLKPMSALPPPGVPRGAVQVSDQSQTTFREWQTCSLACTRAAANEALDWLFTGDTVGHRLHITFGNDE